VARRSQGHGEPPQAMLKVAKIPTDTPITTWQAAGWGWFVKTRKGFTVGGCMTQGQAERVGDRLLDRGK